MRATEDASRGPFHVLERRHSLAKIVERGAVVPAERLSVHFPHLALRIVGEDPVCLALVDRVYPPRRQLRGNVGRSRRSIAIILAVVGAFGLVVLLIGCGVYAGCICVHNRANAVDNRPPMLRAEADRETVNVGALMTVQVPEGLGPGSVFTVDVPGRGACRVTVPPGVFAGQTFTLLHPDYVGTSN